MAVWGGIIGILTCPPVAPMTPGRLESGPANNNTGPAGAVWLPPPRFSSTWSGRYNSLPSSQRFSLHPATAPEAQNPACPPLNWGVGMARQVSRHENCCLEELHRSPSQMPRLLQLEIHFHSSGQGRETLERPSSPGPSSWEQPGQARGGDIRRLSNVTV